MKTAFILHGFNGDTSYTFGPALKDFLEAILNIHINGK